MQLSKRRSVAGTLHAILLRAETDQRAAQGVFDRQAMRHAGPSGQSPCGADRHMVLAVDESSDLGSLFRRTTVPLDATSHPPSDCQRAQHRWQRISFHDNRQIIDNVRDFVVSQALAA